MCFSEVLMMRRVRGAAHQSQSRLAARITITSVTAARETNHGRSLETGWTIGSILSVQD